VDKKEKCFRQIELEYSYDRLSSKKLMQAYRLLVPEKIEEQVHRDKRLGERHGGPANEAGSDLYAGVLGAAKRGTYDW
jgi:hypothetical protein